jgi:hypothetical protein
MSILHYYLGRPAHVWIAMSRRSPASPDRPRPSRYPLAISGEGFEDLVDSLGADERPGSISACPAQPAFVPELGRSVRKVAHQRESRASQRVSC